MKHREDTKRLVIYGLNLLELICHTLLYAYVWFEYYYDIVGRYTQRFKFYFAGHFAMLAIYFILIYYVNKTYGGLKIGFLKPMEVLFSQIFSIILVNIITYLQLTLMNNWWVTGEYMVVITVIQIPIAVVYTVLCYKIYRKLFPPREILLIYGERSIDDILQKFSTRKDKYKIVNCINIKEGLEAVQEQAAKHEAVVLWDISTMARNKLLKFCYSKSIRIYMMPKISDVLVMGADQLHLFDTPILLTREYPLSVEQRIAKRLIDIICSVLLIVITSPIMLITAVCIKCYDRGPVLYKQIRCTQNQKRFQIMKFRSMRVDAEKDGVARLAAKNDDRITPIGKFIRAVRIDELPQLFNILAGDMSFIGPRPERPEIIEQYMEEMPEFVFRMKVKAGLAGYAQVFGKYNTTPYDKLKLDLSYMENYSIWLDLKLMLLTLKILFKPESTEGVELTQITAMKEAEEAGDLKDSEDGNE